MPVADEIKSSWADEVELEGGTLPPSTEVRENGFKIVTDYKLNDDDKKVKIVRTYKIEKCSVSKSIARRKTWNKFGESANDKPGPNPATTIVGEDVYMQYVTCKEEQNKLEEETGIDKLKNLGDKNVVKCRNCNGDHWTSKCPFKDTVLGENKKIDAQKGTFPNATTSGDNPKAKYVPPNMREGATKRSDNPNTQKADTTAIRISNLSEATTDSDLEELVRHFGPIQKLFLAKDKSSALCKGFAYVHFKFKTDAAKAIEFLNGHGYDHLILEVDWSKPPVHNNQ